MNDSSVKSAARVLDLLELLSVTDEALGVSDVSRRLGIPKSSAAMLLATLEKRGYVVGDRNRQFSLPPAFTGEGSYVGGIYAVLRRLARPAMHALVEATGESSFLGILTPGLQLQYIDKALSTNEVRYDTDISIPRALHCTSVGMVLLAYLPEPEIERFMRHADLEKRTTETISEGTALRAELAQIRDRGYACARDTNAVGVAGFAAPVFGWDGTIVAGLNISAPTLRFDQKRDQMRSALLEQAGAVNQAFSRLRLRSAAAD